MRRSPQAKKFSFWFALAAGTIVIAAWVVWRGRRPEPPVVETERVKRGDLIESISATGTLSALQTVTVGTQVSGTVAKIYVDFNSQVKQGELLALIDPNLLDAQLANARAALERAKAQYEDAVAQLKEGEPLADTGYLSSRDIRTLRVNVNTAKAQVQAAQADFDRAQRNRQYAEIRSPIDGVVIERAVDTGQTVAASFQTPTLFVIAQDLKRMQILANVDESQIGLVKLGQAATFAVSAYPASRFTAEVRQIRLKATTTQNVVTYTVVLDAANPSGELFPGMTATVDFIMRRLDNVLQVPTAALRVQPPRELLAKDARSAHGDAAGRADDKRNPQQSSGDARNVATVWLLGADALAHGIPVRILGSDLTTTAVEAIRGELQEGAAVITRVLSAKANGEQAPRGMFGPPGGGRARRT